MIGFNIAGIPVTITIKKSFDVKGICHQSISVCCFIRFFSVHHKKIWQNVNVVFLHAIKVNGDQRLVFFSRLLTLWSLVPIHFHCMDSSSIKTSALVFQRETKTIQKTKSTVEFCSFKKPEMIMSVSINIKNKLLPITHPPRTSSLLIV